MKRIYTLTLAVLLLAGGSAMAQQVQQAQPGAVKTFTLEDCLQYALQNHVDIQNAALDQEIAKARIGDTRGSGLPQVTVASGLTYNPKLPRFFGTYTTPTENSTSFFGDIPGVPNGSILAAQNFFQLKSSGDASVTLNQMLFNGSYFVGLQAASAYKDWSYKNSAATQTTVIQNVTKAYYAALINNDRLTSLDANIARLDSSLRSTKIMNQNGFAESIDVQRLQVSYNNLVTDRDKFFNAKKITVELLKFQMNYPMEDEINVAGSIEDVQVMTDPASYASDFKYENRTDYQVMLSNQKLQALNVKNQYAGILPTLSIYGKTGYQTQSPTIGGLFKTTTKLPFESDMIGPDKWYNYSVIGLNFNWNVFTGLSRHYKIQQEKLSLQKINNNFRRLKSSIDLEVRQTALTYDNALKTLTSQKQNMELASNVYRVTKIKFEQGVGSNLEVVTAEADFRTAQNNYYGALFDAMVAKVDLDKAYGRLAGPTSTK
ncbi:MAG: TolC family protein [Bacteroidota bacterium]